MRRPTYKLWFSVSYGAAVQPATSVTNSTYYENLKTGRHEETASKSTPPGLGTVRLGARTGSLGQNERLLTLVLDGLRIPGGEGTSAPKG